jgi:hypothetical protein
MSKLIPAGGNAFTNTARTTGTGAHCPAAGPDPLVAAIRRRFEAETEAHGVEPPGDTGVLLREIDRLHGDVGHARDEATRQETLRLRLIEAAYMEGGEVHQWMVRTVRAPLSD